MRGNAHSTGQHIDWLYSKNRLSEADCKEIIEVCREFPLTVPKTVGEERLPGHRQGDPRKIGVNPRTTWIFDLLCNVAAEAAKSSGLKITEIARAPQYVEYRSGWGSFDWHNDYSHARPLAPRKLTIIIQLSRPEEYEGGTLQVFGPELENMPRELGSIIAFPSFLFHRVTEVTKGMRQVLVAWIAGPRII